MTEPIYPPAHRRIQFQGTLGQAPEGGSEIFDFGWADSSDMTLPELASAYLSQMQDAWTNPNLVISSTAILQGCRVEEVLASGKVSDSYYVTGTTPSGSSDGANITVLSHCVTLETNTMNGKGRTVRGRFYPPGYESVIGSTAVGNTIVQYATTWASILSGMVAQGLQPAVASVTSGGQIAPVTGVSAGTVIDTVRRRKNHVTVQRSGTKPVG